MNDPLDENFADYEAPGRKPLRYEIRKGREEAERRGAEFLEPPSTRNLGAEIESWWAELRPEERLAQAGNLWQPEFATAGILAKGGQRFFSFLTKTLEEAVAKGTSKGEKFLPNLVGEQILRRLQKVGVSKDELKYTGVADWLKERGKRPIDTRELLEFAKKNELKMKVRELAFEEAEHKDDLLYRITRVKDKLREREYEELSPKQMDFVTRNWKQGAAPGYSPEIKRAMARRWGAWKLDDYHDRLMTQQPSHGEGYYLGGYVLPNKLGLPPAGYRERLYEPNKPEGIDVEFTHRPQYPRAFAHSRGEPRDFFVKGEEGEVPGYMVEELQADTHENVGAYLTGDPIQDAKSIAKVLGMSMQKNRQPYSYTWEFDNSRAEANLFVEPAKKGGFEVRIEGRDLRGPVVESKIFKTPEELKEGLKPFVEAQGLPTEDLFENLRGIYSESETRLAADYPFKKDWWKVQVKDWLKLAAEDPTAKVVGLPSGEMMAERLGFNVWRKGSSAGFFGKTRVAQGLKVDPKTGLTAEDFVEPRGQFAWDLYEKKVPQWIEEEFGIKLEKGVTETNFGGKFDQQGFGMPIAGERSVQEVPVWIVPLDPIREKLKKPLRLSWLTKEARDLA